MIGPLGVLIQAPFALYDWPNPLQKPRASTTFLDPAKIWLIGKDAMAAALGSQTPNPAPKLWKSDYWQSLPVQLLGQDQMPVGAALQNTIFLRAPQPPVMVPENLVLTATVVPGTNPRLILVEGRLAMQVHGMIYMFLD